jgi:hypothetical protein
MAILEWFYLYKVTFEYAKSIFSCTKNTLKAFKRNRRVRLEYFPFMENTPIDIKLSLSWRIFDQNRKNSDP